MRIRQKVGGGPGQQGALEGIERALKKAGRKSQWPRTPATEVGEWSSVPITQALLSLLFSHSVVSDSLRPHGLPHARLPGPLPSPEACSNSCLLSR